MNEPKPEGRLLTIERMAEMACEELGKGDVKVGRLCIRIRNLQNEETSSIWSELLEITISDKDAECQAKIEQTIKDDADRCAGYMKAVRAECEEKLNSHSARLADAIERAVRAECQARVEEILELLPEIPTRFDHNKTCFDCVRNIREQALKKKEGVE